MKPKIIVVLMLLLWSGIQAQTTISIETQLEFQKLDALLLKVLRTGVKDVTVQFSDDTFFFDERNISLQELRYPDVSLHFTGQQTVISAAEQDGAFAQPGYISHGENVDDWTTLTQTDQLIEVLDTAAKSCRLQLPKGFQNANLAYSRLKVTQWYYSSTYKIEKIEGDYVYFTAENLSVVNKKNQCNVNYDFVYGGQLPRFQLQFVPTGEVRRCAFTNLFDIKNCHFDSIEVAGITFAGNCDGGKALININNLESRSLKIHDCHFEGIRSRLVLCEATPNFSFSDNSIHNCYRDCVVSDNASLATHVEGNHFSECGKGMLNSFCVICRGSDYRISNNVVKNFGYGAIGVGVWYKTYKSNPCNGVVTDNEVYYDSAYFADYKSHTLMDAGAIYVWTQNDNSVIINNNVHHYTGMADNRGIYLDDGACNVMVWGNTVNNIPNSYCIDSRSVHGIEKGSGSYVKKANVGNIIAQNSVDGKIRFEK